jgi:hypothetical protein
MDLPIVGTIYRIYRIGFPIVGVNLRTNQIDCPSFRGDNPFIQVGFPSLIIACSFQYIDFPPEPTDFQYKEIFKQNKYKNFRTLLE